MSNVIIPMYLDRRTFYMKHIKTLISKNIKDSLKKSGCKECANSCQSACKTSCTVANLACERN